MAGRMPPVVPGDWALFLDIDGTLLDLAPTPDGVVVPAALPGVLDALATRLGGALALVSGRNLAAVDRLFPGDRDAAGTHGVEWRLGGRTQALAEPWPDALEQEVARQAQSLPGVLVERKARSMALHYSAAPDLAARVRALAEQVVRRADRPLDLLDGKSVVEIVPAGAGKGWAIERFMAQPPYAGHRPVFVGDDVTDENGFAAVNRLGGISVHVGDRATTLAPFALASPDAVRRWLAGLAA